MTKAPTKLTFQQYLAYDDGTDNRYELVDGELVPMPPASPDHSDIIDLLRFAFRDEALRLGMDVKIKSDAGIRTRVDRARLPDLIVVKGEDWRNLKQEGAKSAVLTVPAELAVEVVSPGKENRQRDYQTKALEYELLQVKEYWIVAPEMACVTVLSLQQGALGSATYARNDYQVTDTVRSAIFPQLTLQAGEILAA